MITGQDSYKAILLSNILKVIKLRSYLTLTYYEVLSSSGQKSKAANDQELVTSYQKGCMCMTVTKQRRHTFHVDRYERFFIIHLVNIPL